MAQEKLLKIGENTNIYQSECQRFTILMCKRSSKFWQSLTLAHIGVLNHCNARIVFNMRSRKDTRKSPASQKISTTTKANCYEEADLEVLFWSLSSITSCRKNLFFSDINVSIEKRNISSPNAFRAPNDFDSFNCHKESKDNPDKQRRVGKTTCFLNLFNYRDSSRSIRNLQWSGFFISETKFIQQWVCVI